MGETNSDVLIMFQVTHGQLRVAARLLKALRLAVRGLHEGRSPADTEGVVRLLSIIHHVCQTCVLTALWTVLLCVFSPILILIAVRTDHPRSLCISLVFMRLAPSYNTKFAGRTYGLANVKHTALT